MICINILVLCNVDLSQKWGDYSRIFSLMKSFSGLGHDVTIFVIRPEKKKQSIQNFQENSINVYEIHPPSYSPFDGKRGVGKYVNYVASLLTIQRLAREIMQKKGIDYVYSYMPGIGSSLPAMRIKSKLKVKHVLDFADFHVYVRPKRLVMDSFKNADKIICITSYLKNFLTEKGISEKKIDLVPNGVDLELFDPDKYDPNEILDLRKSFNANHLVVFSGALQDLNMIIKSAQFVIDEIPDTKFIIIGDHRDPNRSKLIWEKKVKALNLEKSFEFLGRRPREEIPKLLLCADVCIDSFPDEPYYAAAHPVKLLEYGACGKPIVATRVAETENLIEHGIHGYLSNPDDPVQYADYILKLLKSEGLRNEISKQFQSYVKANFDWDALASKLESFLEK